MLLIAWLYSFDRRGVVEVELVREVRMDEPFLLKSRKKSAAEKVADAELILLLCVEGRNEKQES